MAYRLRTTANLVQIRQLIYLKALIICYLSNYLSNNIYSKNDSASGKQISTRIHGCFHLKLKNWVEKVSALSRLFLAPSV